MYFILLQLLKGQLHALLELIVRQILVDVHDDGLCQNGDVGVVTVYVEKAIATGAVA